MLYSPIESRIQDEYKITARQTVHSAGVPVIPGSTDAVNSVEEIKELAF
jgi:biotin carboxylase